MTADPFDSPEVAVRRSKDGRPYVHDPEKGKEALYTRVTTFIDCLDDKTMLAKWAERMAFLGVRSDLSVGKRLMALELVPELSKSPTQEEVVERNGLLDEQKKKLQAIVDAAKDAAGWKDKADLGTELHRLTELVDGGGHLGSEVPPVLARDVDAYSEALPRYGLVPLEQEVFVANDQLRTGGTFDRVYDWTRPDGTTLRVIGDLKTGRVDYGHGKLAMQLALYANSRRYDPRDPECRGKLDVSTQVGLIIHLPVGKAECKVYAADLLTGWEGVLLADKVRE